MKRAFISLFLLSLLLFVPFLSACGAAEPVTKLYVYNWGEYMSLGNDGGIDVNEEFEAWYYAQTGRRVEVVYSVFASNEEMYAKLQNGSSKVDVIVPSEYMIERLMAEDKLLPLDFSLIGAYEDAIEERFRALPTAPYCVPYTYGYLGLIYDESLDGVLRDENGDISWRVLWSEIPGGVDLSGNILNFNNPRDAFGIAQFILNYEKALSEGVTPGTTDWYVNTTDHARWDEVGALMAGQKSCLQAYVMDEIYNKMEGGAALLAPYYAGDYFTMVDVNERLCFAYPKEGTNFFYDAMCVPKTSKNPELAQMYINFMLGGTDGESLDVAIENAEYVGYSSPNVRVSTNLDYLADMTDDEDGYGEDALWILYPESNYEHLFSLVEPYAAWRAEAGDDYDPEDYEGERPTVEMLSDMAGVMPTYIYTNLDNETLRYSNDLWEALKLESAPCTEIYVLTGVIVLLLVGGAVFFCVRRRKRAQFY